MQDIVLTLREVREEALDTKTFVFDAEGLVRALPGQYLMFKLDVPTDARRGSRSFTMANAPGTEPVMITTRIRSASPFKARLAALVPGERLLVKGPVGRFTFHEGDAPAVFLAGGIGVTPFRSMIKHAIDTNRTTPITLLTSDRVPEAIPFRAEFDRWAATHPWLSVARTITRPHDAREAWSGHRGRMSREWIRSVARNLDGAVAYVCGPPRFVDELSSFLETLGIPKDRIRAERFIGY